MPWQRHYSLLSGELVETENGILIPAYRESGFTVPRQSGKTTIKQAIAQQRANGDPWQGPQRVLYSAQNGRAASEKLTEDWFPDFERQKARLGVARMYRGVGKEGMTWNNCSRLSIMADDPASGHGKTLHLGLQDELFADTDERRDGAMVPAMNTVADAQIVKTSTAGTMDSATWNALVARGRAAAEAGQSDGLCWVEYSAPPGSDPDDPAVWAACMPALGFTITHEAVRHARATLSLSEFCRAYLNIPVGAADDFVLGAGVWERGRVSGTLVPPLRRADAPALAVHVSRERDYSWISAAVPFQHEGTHGVLSWMHREGPGTHWLVDELKAVHADLRQPIRFLNTGPAASAASEAAAIGVPMVGVPSTQYAAACGGLFDAVTSPLVTLWHPANPRLDHAAAHLLKRPSGQQFVWDDHAPDDPAPLTAMTLARHVAVGTPRTFVPTPGATGVI
jgi:hypothetical protein